MGWLGIIGNLIEIGKGALEARQKRKAQADQHDFNIKEALNKAEVDRILSNTSADNQIDLQTARDKAKGWKDEVLSYTILIPLVCATLVPVFICFRAGTPEELLATFSNSYKSLDSLPKWYKWALGAVIIDILGFRSFTRKLVEVLIIKFKNKIK